MLRRLTIIVTFLALLTFYLPTASVRAFTYPTQPGGLPSGKVVTVIDGDTADVMVNGKTERLRMIGIDTLETRDPRTLVQCFGQEASTKAKELLAGQTVHLEMDASQDTRDRYGRLLVYARVGSKLFNLDMIAGGYAHEYTSEAAYKYQAVFTEAEREAAAAQRGFWAATTRNGDTTKAAAPAQADRLCFAETSQCISGWFRQYWEQNGGLPVFGFPITAAANEINPGTGQTCLKQWFQRNRFELHLENAPPYDVLLGRLGDDRLRQQGREWQAFPKAQAAADHYFRESGHAVETVPFWTYWSTHGLEIDGRQGTSVAESLALFGLPISEPSMETNATGDNVLTHWFERARFAYHPNDPDPGAPGAKVLLGLLGNEVSTGGSTPAPQPQP
ncbi:MAG TPA: thermonuclease family protein, partial [Herpetosiphonaceae bacterium]|nr:thermonuclease family protein [Herpetosiphonaceae bacterium]